MSRIAVDIADELSDEALDALADLILDHLDREAEATADANHTADGGAGVDEVTPSRRRVPRATARNGSAAHRVKSTNREAPRRIA